MTAAKESPPNPSSQSNVGDDDDTQWRIVRIYIGGSVGLRFAFPSFNEALEAANRAITKNEVQRVLIQRCTWATHTVIHRPPQEQ